MTQRHIASICIELLKDALVDRCASSGVGELEEKDWRELIGFSSSHFILAAISKPLSRLASERRSQPDAAAFIQDMGRRNAQRNEELRSALLQIGAALNQIGATPIALKGAAFLLDKQDDAAPWRFMSDIDLLVTEEVLNACVEALRSLGYGCDDGSYDPATDAHYPPMISPCGTYSVELHTRLFGLSDFGLDVRDLRRNARPSPNAATRISVPTYSDRILHVLLHAQMHNRNHVKHRLVLKDILDLSVLERTRADGSSLYEDMCRLNNPFVVAAVGGLVEAWIVLMEEGPRTEPLPWDSGWAEHAIDRLYWGRFKSLANVPADILKVEAHRLRTEEGHLNRRAHQILHPRELRHATQSWLHKQRQRYWA